MESGSRLERRDNGADLSSCTTFCCEEVRAFDAKDGRILKLESGIRAENRKDLSSCGSLCSGETCVPDANGTGVLEIKTSVETADWEDPISFESPFLVNVGFSGANSSMLLKFVNKADLGPVTPILDRQNVTPILDRQNVEISTPSDLIEQSDLVLGCQTPTDGIFDPFAPGPEELMFAPKKKMLKETRVPIRRQLNFDYCGDTLGNIEDQVLESDADEESFLEMVYRSFLDVIVSHQLGECSAESSLVESNFCDVKTPTSLPFLTGIAETCPGAPVRPTLKSRKLSSSICRKLEF